MGDALGRGTGDIPASRRGGMRVRHGLTDAPDAPTSIWCLYPTPAAGDTELCVAIEFTGGVAGDTK